MKRVALSIGCDDYEFLQRLSGAASDARRVYETLIDQNHGEYDSHSSLLLLSPTLDELRKALRHILFGCREVDTFTFFFAGHGGVKAASYYLCTTDSQLRMLSSSALGMTELFSVVNEVQPRQSNIILDACQAGGIVTDLHALLKPELIGGSQTPGITILASSAADQYSSENEEGGFGTIELMGCMDGTVVVQTLRPTLDLLEIGRAAALLVASKYPGQTPVLWGLNLYGEVRFCKNPHYAGIMPPVPSLPQISPGSPQYDVIRRDSEAIWREYLSVESDFDPRRLLERMVPAILAPSCDAGDAAVFARGLAKAFSIRAAESSDIFQGARVMAVCTVALLDRAHEESIGDSIVDMASQTLELAQEAIAETAKILSENEYALISGKSALGDLFYLPMRLSQLLGWIGAQHFIGRWAGRPDAFDEKDVEAIVRRILGMYSPSLASVSDVQAPYLLTFLSCCRQRGWNDTAESIIGHIANSLIASNANVASPNIDPHRVFEFLNRLLDENFSDAFDLLARPCELLSVLLMMGHCFGLHDALDPDLHLLDHVSLNVFIPRDHREFSKPTIRNGINHTYEIGRGIWTLEDFYSVWASDCVAQINADPYVQLTSVKIGALYAALLFPDRSPWFVATDSSD
jgi:Caspase domain